MTTNTQVQKDTHRRIKIYAAQRGIKMSQALTELVEAGLKVKYGQDEEIHNKKKAKK